MIISIDAEIAFDKTQQSFINKNTQQNWNRGKLLPHNKSHIWKIQSKPHSMVKGWILLRSGTRQGGTLSRLLFNRVLATAIRQEKKEKEKRKACTLEKK